MMRRLTQLLVGLALGCSMMPAAAQEAEAPVVKIDGFKKLKLNSYRAMVAGLDAFDQHHGLAPAIPELRFHFETHGDKDAPGVAPQLRIVGDEFSQYVPIGPDGRFSLPRLQQAIDENAVLTSNIKKMSYRMGVDVRSPGLPENVRRLGDLRLECKVLLAIGKHEAPFWVVAAANTFLMTGDWCSKLKGDAAGYPISVGAKVTDAHLVQGERRLRLKADKRSYAVPIGDLAWGDDALVELSFASGETQ